MSFRTEEKILINLHQLFNFNKWMNLNKSIRMYPSRKIESIYFENLHDQMFFDSEEGCAPRKKIRIRNYPDCINDNNNYFQIKISSAEGRFKTSEKLSKKNYDKFIRLGYLDNNYGMCLPKIKVSYLREYFEVLNSRVTIDTNICYNNYKNDCIIIKDNQIVIEIKQNKNVDLSKLYCDFPFQRTRFSKYCRAYIHLNN